MSKHTQCKLEQAPANFVMAIDNLCQGIRLKQNNVTAKSHNLYRSFILENIKSVIDGSFPLFQTMICPNLLASIIEDFLAHHDAIEPQFHHIATEFLRFAQSSQLLPKALLSLLEYEWLLFSTEINPKTSNSQSQLFYSDNDIKHNIEISINPTAAYICMPFELAHYHEYCPINHGQFIYSVFRNLNGHVITKRLSSDEANLLKDIDFIHSQSFWKKYKVDDSAINQSTLTSLIEIHLVHIKHEE